MKYSITTYAGESYAIILCIHVRFLALRWGKVKGNLQTQDKNLVDGGKKKLYTLEK